MEKIAIIGSGISGLNVGEYFRHYYLLPMGASIWSTPSSQMHDFPAITFLRFFNNHGLLNIKAPVRWYTVDGGSKVYTTKLIDSLEAANVTFQSGVDCVKRSQDQVFITDQQGTTQTFDKVIFATHSDEALKLLHTATTQERDYLSAIKYQDNQMVLHSDQRLMPKRKKTWSSWVYLSNSDQFISLSYWMNKLQSLSSEKDYFVTINPAILPREESIIDQHVFRHPAFDHAAIIAQQKLMDIQGQHNTYYCGAYLRYGFHEDGIFSAVEVAKMLGVDAPWN
ncbi:NAD(P)/FAD-dependent oxidoreductase [Cysteiniphilum halobium]|uniref:NAD(P)/FAD-dependent oxidoreductase n=1 Tax=Cysteiniphilum halobium TaxID=2219059 RepID=UPI003F83F651